MCKILEDMINETAILAAIETARYLKLPEDKVKKMVMERYKFDEVTADCYLLKVGS